MKLHNPQKSVKMEQSISVKGVTHMVNTPKVVPVDKLITNLVGYQVPAKKRKQMEKLKKQGMSRKEIAKVVNVPKFYVNMILGGSL